MPAPNPSPLDQFVAGLRGIAAGRWYMIAALPASKITDDWRVLVDDVQMMLHEGVVIGLRTTWVRRIAVPIYKAHTMLTSGNGTPKERAVKAIEILEQCSDKTMAAHCAAWIRETYK